MFVMRYYENGDLYSYLEESMGILCWRDIIDILWSISTGLEFIHEYNLVHGHLHGGNILVENEMNSIDAKITDTGLHGPADKSMASQQIYGVVPFVAPEIFKKNLPTKESDIYSFASQICECLGNWVSAVNDDPHPSDLSNQFDTAEEIKFKNIGKLELNKISYHEKAIYISRPLDSINIESSESK
ncbi:Cla4p [Rhizophagus irregularis DAOM 197198w]|uniref:Cla4p n=1 Tax=Rhizophagus irregularis (strain DAOM 197198w) TaxID=1432141 RepID=A0A015L677_RHIIW|nr:Cla4p [Rhizophagus irregularis DAOM 197198w]